VNSEFYAGWLDHWQQKHASVAAQDVDKTLEEMLSIGASVNIYMFHGGTSFGLTSGSNSDPFSCTPTSYDYDAPISESGDVGEKFWTIRRRISKYRPVPSVPPHFVNTTEKGQYGPVIMRFVGSFFDLKPAILKKYGHHKHPLSFEKVNQNTGFMLYETTIPGLFRDPAILKIPGLADRAQIFLDYRFVGLLSREENQFSLPIQTKHGQRLSILVENQGRICYGEKLADRKGIVGDVTLAGKTLTQWEMSGLPLDSETVDHLDQFAMKSRVDIQSSRGDDKSMMGTKGMPDGTRMGIWMAEFRLATNAIYPTLLDTFLRLQGWHKGVVLLNGVVLGRFWPTVGPQETLYLPSELLVPPPGENRLIILDESAPECSPVCSIQFTTTSQLDGPTPDQQQL